MKVTGPPGRWKELGRLLRLCRGDLDPRYRDRSALSRSAGINDRMLGDLENGRRQAYKDTSLRVVSSAYGLQPDAIELYMSGEADRLIPAPAKVPTPPLTGLSDVDARLAVELDVPPVELQAPSGRIVGERPLFVNEILIWWPRPNGGFWYRMIVDPDDVDLRTEAASAFPEGHSVEEVVQNMRNTLDSLKRRD